VLTLREKGKQLECKLRELIEFGEENDAISEKLHRLTLALVGARDAEAVIEALYFTCARILPCRTRCCGCGPRRSHPQLPEFGEVSAEARDFAASLASPYCSTHAMVDTGAWFWRTGATAALACLRRVEAGQARSGCSRWRARTPSASIRRWARCI
jgi:hypothetical protein